MRKTLAVISIVSLIFGACEGDKATKSKQPTSVLIALKAGNWWQYTDTLYLYNGEKWDASTQDAVLGTLEIDGSSWYLVQSSFNGEVSDTVLMDNRADGVWSRRLSGTLALPHLIYKYPAQAGDTFTAYTYSRVTVQSTNAEITTPAGTFRCYQYVTGFEDSSFWWSESTWVAPDVGLVQQVQVDTAGLSYLRILEAYGLR